MKVVVTGGAGFIGSHVVDALLADGAKVHVLDNLSSGRPANLAPALERGAELHTVDVTDDDETVRVMTLAGPRVVIHLAAQIDVRRSVDRPAFDATVNVAGTAAVLEAARRAGVPRVVLASTAAVYGQPDKLPTPERAPLRPLTPYGTAKAAAEAYLDLYRRLYGLSTLTLRMANVYGPRQDPHGESGVVAIFSGAAAERRPVTIHGDGHQTRDYVHVDDVARAFLRAAATGTTGAVNIATGRETSVRQLAELLSVEVLQGPGRVGEIPRSCLDPAAASRRLGWSARTPLRSGLTSLRAVPAETV
jgi:UDP-glucose 4-epimerase